jgi:hypothetical protein
VIRRPLSQEYAADVTWHEDGGRHVRTQDSYLPSL